MLNFRRGFTILEALITLALLGIVAAFVIPKFGEVKEQAYIDAMKNDLHNLALAENEHLLDHHAFVEPNLLENRDEWTRTDDVFQIRYLQDRGEWFFMEVGHRKTDVTCGLEYTPELDDDYKAIENRIECPPDRKLFDDGDLIVRTRTTGDDPDSNGYVVAMDNGRFRSIGTNDELLFAAREPGVHSVDLANIADQCEVTGGPDPRDVTVVAGEETAVTFDVSCGDDGGGDGDSDASWTVETQTTGDGTDPDGYTVSLDGGSFRAVGLNDSETYEDLNLGEHTVGILDLADNCQVINGASERVGTLSEGEAKNTLFEIECSSTTSTGSTGSVQVITETSGDNPDADGYYVGMDGTDLRTIGVNDTVVFTDRGTGNHSLELGGLASQCEVTNGSSQRTVSVVEDSTVSETYQLDCGGSGDDDDDGSATLVIRTQTDGDSLDADGYRASVSTSGSTTTTDIPLQSGATMDGETVSVLELAINDEQTLQRLQAGTYEVTLSDVAPQCQLVWGGKTRSAELQEDRYHITYDLLCSGSDDGEPPTAVIDYTPSEFCVGDLIEFSGAASSDPDGSIVEYRWSFSDGERATGETHQRTFPSVQTLLVELVVEDDDGLTDRAETGLQPQCNNKTPSDKSPVADFTHTPEGPISPGSSYQFDASPSFDPEGTLQATKQWSFGDGANKTVSTDTTSHVFSSTGDYNVQLTVVDSAGQTASTTKTLSVREDGDEDQLPVAKFSYDPQEPDNLDPVAFDGTASYDPDGGSVDHRWQFENRVTKGDAQVEYVFSDIGTREACLTVTDDEGDTDQECKFIEVGPRPPVAKFSHDPDTAFATDEVTFDGRDSFDEDGTIEDWTWTIEGGTKTGSVVTHTFADNGTYPVQLVVTDNDGAKDTLVQNIGIGNKNPVADFEVSPLARHANQQLTFDGSASHDPDGSIESWSWDIDGEATPSGEVVTHTFSTSGSKVIKLTVTDNEGATDAKIDTIQVAPPNEAPDAQLWVPNRRYEKTSVTIDGSGSSDPDGTIADYQWTFTKEDGSTSSSSGSATLDKIFTTHGTYQVELTVVDNDGATDTAVDSIRITQEAELVAHWDRCAGFDTGTYPDVAGGADATLINVEGDPDDWSPWWDLSGPVLLKIRDPNRWTTSDVYGALPTNAIDSEATDFTVAFHANINGGEQGGVFLSSENTNGGASWELWGGGEISGTTDTHLRIAHLGTTVSWAYHTVVIRVFERLNGDQSATIFLDGEQYASGVVASFDEERNPMTLSGQMNLFADLSGNSRPTTQITDFYYYDGAATNSEAQNLTNTLDSSTCPDANRAPTADFTFPKSRRLPGQSLTFDASATVDSFDTIAEHAWSFGDGETARTETDPTVSHAYDAGGDYDVRLIATDSHGARDTVSKTIHIAPHETLVAHWDPGASFDSGTLEDVVGGYDADLQPTNDNITTRDDWENEWAVDWVGSNNDEPRAWWKGWRNWGAEASLDQNSPDYTVSVLIQTNGFTGSTILDSNDRYGGRVSITEEKTSATDWEDIELSIFGPGGVSWEDRIVNNGEPGWITITVTFWNRTDGDQWAKAYINGQPACSWSGGYAGCVNVQDVFDHRYSEEDQARTTSFSGIVDLFEGDDGPHSVSHVMYFDGVMTDADVANHHTELLNKTATLEQVNRPPEAAFTIEPTSQGSNPIEGEVTTLDASGTTDFVDDGGLTYTWKVDGTEISNSPTMNPTIDHTFKKFGHADITLIVDDGVTGADTVSKSVWVSEADQLVADYDPCEGGLGEDFIADAGSNLRMQLEGAGVPWDSVWNYAAPQNLDTFNHPNIEGWTGSGILTNAEKLDRGKPDFTLAFYLFEAGDTGSLFRAMSDGGVPWSISDARAVSGEWSSLIVRFRKQGPGSQTKEWFVNGNFQQSVDLNEVLTVNRTSDGQWKFFQDTEDHIHRVMIYDGVRTDSEISGLHDGLVAGASTSCSN